MRGKVKVKEGIGRINDDGKNKYNLNKSKRSEAK